ncbi:MAG: dihydrodipicolinate reductase C-terminal domain-containing protein [Planctomycetota bacterium]
MTDFAGATPDATVSHASRVDLVVHGPRGRMGQRIVALASSDARVASVYAWDREQSCSALVSRAAAPVVLIDVTSDHGALRAINEAHDLKIPVCIATTGLRASTEDRMRAVSSHVPVLFAPNTSMGMAVLRVLLVHASERLAQRADVRLSEAHHHAKKDAPSGTARVLRKILNDCGFPSISDAETDVVRAGDTIGTHVVTFTLGDETLSMRHECHDRDVFARGAIDAACWLATQSPGMYDMDDVIASSIHPDG